MTQLDDRMRSRVHTVANPRPDADLRIEYLAAPPGGTSVFEISALVRALRGVLAAARPLRATDVDPHGSAKPEQDATVSADRSRLQTPLTALDTLRSDVATQLATLAPLVGDPVGQLNTMLANVDTYLDAAVNLLDRGARFRLPA